MGETGIGKGTGTGSGFGHGNGLGPEGGVGVGVGPSPGGGVGFTGKVGLGFAGAVVFTNTISTRLFFERSEEIGCVSPLLAIVN
jgi:hypothetical protein